MPLDVVDGDEGDAVCHRQTLGKVNAHQQRADKAGICRHGNGVHVLQADACHLESLVCNAGDSLGVCAAGNLGHDTAVKTVGLDLGCDYIRFYCKAAVLRQHNRCAGLITRAFKS